MRRREFLTLSAAALVSGSGCSRGIPPASNVAPEALPDSPSTAPQSLSREAEDSPPPAVGWPRLHGPNGHSVSEELGLIDSFPATGPEILWDRYIGTGYSAPVVTEAGLILLHRKGDREILECLHPETGATQWTHSWQTAYECRFEYSSGSYSTPLIAGSIVIACGAEGWFHGVDFATGKELWQRNLHRELDVPPGLFAVGASPCPDGTQIIFPLGGRQRQAGVIALDIETGQTRWTATDHGASYATPVVTALHGRRWCFVFTQQGLVALDPDKGTQHWFIPFGVGEDPDSVNAVAPLIWQDLLLLSAGPGPGNLCLRIRPDGSHETVWKNRRALDSQFNNQICRDGFVYGFTSKWNKAASLVCLDLRNGDIRWIYPSDLMRGSGLLADGKLILLGEHGHLALLRATPDADAPEVLGFTAEPLLSRPTYSAPALCRGRLYLRNEKRLLCLDLRKHPN